MLSGTLFLSLLLLLLYESVPHLQAQADDVRSHLQRARQYLQQQQPDLARREFALVVATEPGSLDAQANLGVLLYFAGDYPGAVPHLRKALEIDGRQSKLRALLGLSERRNGDAQTARTDLEAALPGLTDPKVRKQAGLELVELESAASDLAAAAATVNALKVSMPTDAEVLYAAYRVHTDLAGEAMLDLSLAGPDSPQIHQLMAHELIKARDNAGAIRNLREAIASDPHLPGAHFELGELLAQSSSPELKAEAPQQYQAALLDNPRDDKALTRLGDLLAARGEHASAIGDYKRALELEPRSVDAAVGMAHELVEAGQLEAALPFLLRAVDTDPSDLLAHFRLSALYRRLHRADDAKREVAEYERLKAAREKLRGVFGGLRADKPLDERP